MKRVWAYLVSLISWVVWHDAAIPADDDDIAARFRRHDGAGW